MTTAKVTPRPLWVFGYGSLLWKPGFAVAETRRGRVAGFRRRFCMWSVHHRGTARDPGLVLALEEAEGAVCEGLALRVADADAEAALAYLRERELVSSAYVERVLPVALEDGGEVAALAYVMDVRHPQYTGDLSLERQAEVIARSHGGMGPNAEYLWQTAAHLEAVGIRDETLRRLARMVRDRIEGR